MALLNITKVAVGCASVEELAARIAARAGDAAQVPVHTRYRPKRAEELIGGSLYWIIKHRLAVRQTIMGFEDSEDGRRCLIMLEPRIVAVQPRPRRAHQGWRYLEAGDAPPDLDGGDSDLGALPPKLMAELSALLLI